MLKWTNVYLLMRARQRYCPAARRLRFLILSGQHGLPINLCVCVCEVHQQGHNHLLPRAEAASGHVGEDGLEALLLYPVSGKKLICRTNVVLIHWYQVC